MISIILNRYDPTKWQTHMTMACLAAITKFTDDEYEIIVVDNEPKFPIRDDYNNLHPYTHIVNEENKTVYESYNQGAEVAKGDVLMFIQNDVFVHERTINELAKYVTLYGYDVAYPQQVPITREQVKSLGGAEDPEFGWRDAGLLAISREAFDETGGWPGEYKNLLGEAAYYKKIDECGLKWTCQTNALITHIMAANNLSKDEELYAKEMAHDAKILEEK